MSTEHTRIDALALTKAEHDALNLTRPFTDAALGAWTASRRSTDAFCSSLFDEAGVARAEWTKPAPPSTRIKIRKKDAA